MATKKKEPVVDDLLGTIEHLVMRGVYEIGETGASGVMVYDAIRERVFAGISFGSVFTALERLTWKGYLDSKMGQPENGRGGRARKIYRVTGAGKKVLEFNKRVNSTPLVLVEAKVDG